MFVYSIIGIKEFLKSNTLNFNFNIEVVSSNFQDRLSNYIKKKKKHVQNDNFRC